MKQDCQSVAQQLAIIFHIEKKNKENSSKNSIFRQALMSLINGRANNKCLKDQHYITIQLTDIREWYDSTDFSGDVEEQIFATLLRFLEVGGPQEFSVAEEQLINWAEDGYYDALYLLIHSSKDPELLSRLLKKHSTNENCFYSLWYIENAKAGRGQKDAIAHLSDAGDNFCRDAMKQMTKLSLDNLIGNRLSAFEPKRDSFSRLERYASFGMVEAQYTLGLLYQHGDFVDKDIEEARYWYALAAPKYPKAKNRLTTLP